MKRIVLFLALSSALSFSDGLLDDRVFEESPFSKVKESFLKTIKENCYQNSTGNYERFMELLQNTSKCLEVSLTQSPIFVTPLKVFKDNIQGCVNDLVEELEDCLPEDSKDWPQLNFDILYSFVDFVYEHKERLLAPKTRVYFQECVSTVNKKNESREFLECLNFSPLNMNTLAVKVACQELFIMEKCFMPKLNKTCPSDEETEKLISELLTTMKQPCIEYDVTENPLDNVFTLLTNYAPQNINPDLM